MTFALFVAEGVAVAQNTVRWTTNYYSVTGATVREVRRSMSQARPWKRQVDVDAITAWSVTWTYHLAPAGQGCVPTGIATTTTITTTLPRYVAPTNAPAELRELWKKYFVALARHESQHGANALAAAASIHGRLSAGGSGRDCDSTRREMEALAKAILELNRRNDRDLDERTRHGATEGARFP